jgi:hypothetical protein
MPGQEAKKSFGLFRASTIRALSERNVAVLGDANQLTARRSTAARSASQLSCFLQFRAANAGGEALESLRLLTLDCGRRGLLARNGLLFEG